MNRRKSLALVAVAATTALTLSACGGGSSGGGTPGSSPKDTGAVLPNTAWAKASYDEVKQGGTLVQAVGQLPEKRTSLGGW